MCWNGRGTSQVSIKSRTVAHLYESIPGRPRIRWTLDDWSQTDHASDGHWTTGPRPTTHQMDTGRLVPDRPRIRWTLDDWSQTDHASDGHWTTGPRPTTHQMDTGRLVPDRPRIRWTLDDWSSQQSVRSRYNESSDRTLMTNLLNFFLVAAGAHQMLF